MLKVRPGLILSFLTQDHISSLLCYSKSIVTPYTIPDRALSIDEPPHFMKAKTDWRETVDIEIIASQMFYPVEHKIPTGSEGQTQEHYQRKFNSFIYFH